MRQAKAVASANVRDRDDRPDGVEQRVGGRRGASVVTELEHVGAQVRSGRQFGLANLLGIAREQHAALAGAGAQGEAPVIRVGVGAGGIDLDARAVRGGGIPAGPKREHADAPGFGGTAQRGDPAFVARDVSDDDERRPQQVDHAHESSRVVCIGVRRDEHVDTAVSRASQPRQHAVARAARRVAPATAAVDQDAGPIDEVQQRAVAVPHRDRDDVHLSARAAKGRRRVERKGERQPRAERNEERARQRSCGRESGGACEAPGAEARN